MSFPNDRDRALIRSADQVGKLAGDLSAWLATFGRPTEQQPEEAAVSQRDELQLLQLHRAATNLCRSARHPVAAAVYGPSQVGKSLLVGRILSPCDCRRSPLGRDERHGEPGYFTGLSFEVDLNPQNGSNEATALVTRFTTSDRLSSDTPPEFPVVARAMSRGQLLQVLARGFSIECAARYTDRDAPAIERAIVELGRRYPAAHVDEAWRSDLLDAYAAMQACDARRFEATEQSLATALAEQALTSEGYLALAALLFWDNWRSLTGLFLRIDEFLAGIKAQGPEPELLLHWAAVRFLLDSKRAAVHERRGSRAFARVEWSDFQLTRRGRWPVLEHRPGSGAYREPLETIQAALLELVVPILPQRLHDDWRQVLEQNDILDIPGLRAGRQGVEQGKRTSADTLDEQLEILKRGKVAFLFEHYTQQFQIQTLLLLARGGNLEVSSQLKHHLDRWGQSRYGTENWPAHVPAGMPALFIGLTGIDEEFRQREEFAEPMLYDTRLTQLADTLGSVATQFGGVDQPFTNIYPLRYPGSWDADSQQREREGADKWRHAGRAFLASSCVNRFVDDASAKWTAALRDGDGGLSLVSAGWRSVTTPALKQDQLQSRLNETRDRLLELAHRWIVNPDRNWAREQRIACAKLVLDWLTSDEQLIYDRVGALRHSLGLHEGEQFRLADFAEQEGDQFPGRRHSSQERFADLLREFLHQWSERQVIENWNGYVQSHRDRGPWLASSDIGRLAGYMADYFCSPAIFVPLQSMLWQVIGVKLRDEGARREGRRRYVRLILNDLVLNPGLAPPREAPSAEGDDCGVGGRFGLMAPFVQRWQSLLPEVLAAGAGDAVHIPSGNQELLHLLEGHASA